MARGTVVGYEALARFTGYPVRDPETWFAAARRHEVLPALEAVALRTALAARSELPGNTFLTVNLGPDVIDSPEVREVLAAQPGLSGVVVELTEHARVDSYASLEPAIDRLRYRGRADRHRRRGVGVRRPAAPAQPAAGVPQARPGSRRGTRP